MDDGKFKLKQVKEAKGLRQTFKAINSAIAYLQFRPEEGKGCCNFIMFVMDLAMIVIGAVNLTNCPVDPRIPIWLLVCGSCRLFDLVINGCFRLAYRHMDDHERENPHFCMNYVAILFQFLLIIATILGAVWVYGAKGRVQHDSADEAFYCDHLAYMFAFVFITFCLGMLLLVCLLAICCFGCIGCIYMIAGEDKIRPINDCLGPTVEPVILDAGQVKSVV